ncbi:hypothetical protein HA402_002671 [Bradysia odoriphaga]|nr:hypothetical protein HA402_002671 [Bradysia odoriphaga]
MGGDQSTFEIPLYPQPHPICATEARFCLPHYVQLRLREKYWSVSGSDFKICDATDKTKIYFHCDGSATSWREKKTLYDDAGTAVCNMKEKLSSFTDIYRVFAGHNSERQICTFKTKLNFLKSKVSTLFPDVMKPDLYHHLVLKGDWRTKRCVIFLGEPKLGGIPIARIFRPYTGRTVVLSVDDYILEVAAGVDIAICVMMCIALDDHDR